MKNISKKNQKQLIIGLLIIIVLVIISIILYNETSLVLTGLAIMLLAVLFKIFFINHIYKK